MSAIFTNADDVEDKNDIQMFVNCFFLNIWANTDIFIYTRTHIPKKNSEY